MIALLAYTGMWRTWRIFTAFLSIDLAATAFVVQFDTTDFAYQTFYAVWSYSAAALYLLVDAELYLEVCRSYSLAGCRDRIVLATIIGIGVLILAACPLLAASGRLPVLVSAYSTTAFSLWIAGVSMFFGVFIGSEARSKNTITHGRCLTLYLGSNALACVLTGVFGINAHFSNTLLYTGQILALVGWAAFLRREKMVEPTIAFDVFEITELKRKSETLEGLKSLPQIFKDI